MKKRKMFTLIFACVFCLSIGTLHAAVVSLLPTAQNVAPGDPFELSLVYDFSEGMLGGDININFDDTVLNFQSFSWDPTLFATISAPVTGLYSDPVDISNGTIGLVRNVLFASFLGITGTGTVGTLFFEADAMAAPGSTLLSLSEGGPWFDLAGAQITPELNGAQVNVVPIPGALWLLGTGLVGLVGLNRRRKA